MLALFCMSLGALAALQSDAVLPTLIVLLAGYAAIFVLDPMLPAAERASVFLATEVDFRSRSFS